MSIAPSRTAPAPLGASPAEPPVPPAPSAPSADDRLQQLAALRAELDGVDDRLHDLLMHRAELVTAVGALGAKGPVPLRPGREASILRRLLGRNRGALAPETLVRIWRAILAGSSAQQNPMRLVVSDPALLPAAREHFGAIADPEALSPAEALAQLRDGRASLALLPVPSDTARWWATTPPGVHVVARLPFWRWPGAVEAVVLSAAEPDPGGRDRSLLVGSPEALASFAPAATLAREGAVALVEVEGFVTAADPRLREAQVTRLGAYAVQMGDTAAETQGVDR